MGTFKKNLQQSVSLLFLSMMIFSFVEPSLGQALEQQFTVSQTVSSEVAFSSAPSNVTFSSSLTTSGGDVANGATQIVVTTNNTTGYTVSLVASSSPAMKGNRGLGTTNTIPDYIEASYNVPDYTFVNGSSGSYARFGYSVSASSSSDVATIFKNNGGTCATGSSSTYGQCWIGASTTARNILVTSSATSASGSTSTLSFRVSIPSSPSPAVIADTYVATSTLTLTAN